jgi:gamma-D-glutamyl-L-lysine dipeptidyl-peptidase
VKNNYFFKKQFSNIYKKASKNSEVTSQIIYGEGFKILSKNKEWIRIRLLFDNYTGYIENKNYAVKHYPKYKVYSLRASIFNKKNEKTKTFLAFGSKIEEVHKNKNYIEFEKNRWIKRKDIKVISHKEKNFIKIFKLFLKTKYVWGGKTFKGIDCSALLQIFYYYNQSFYPRDTIDQIKYSKRKITDKVFKKGDIIFWQGHVAICINSKRLIHAYGPEKKVLIMPILETIKRIKKTAKLVVKKISPIKY